MSIWSSLANPLALLANGGVQIWANERTNEANERMTEDTNRINRENVLSTNQYNMEIARMNNQAAVDLWHEQTAYNSPAEQMKRLEAAGLNPNLVYGQVAESRASNPPAMQGATMQAPHADAARFNYRMPDMLGMLSTYQQVKNLQGLNALQRVQTDKVKAEANSATAQAEFDNWRYKFMREHNMIDANPIRGWMNRGNDMLENVGNWIGTSLGNITAGKEKARGGWQLQIVPAGR